MLTSYKQLFKNLFVSYYVHLKAFLIVLSESYIRA